MNGRATWLAIALWSALLAGFLVAWSPLYWPYTVSITALSAVAVLWSFVGDEFEFTPELILIVLIAAWGPLQICLGRTAIPFLTLRASLTWIGCGVAFVLGSNILADHRPRNLFLRMLMWSVAVLAVEALLQGFLAPRKVFGLFEGAESVTGTMFYRNQFAALMEIGGAAALWQALKGHSVIGALCFALTFGAVVATASRAGAALMLVEVLAFLALSLAGGKRTGNFRAVALVIATFVLAAAAVVGTDTLWERFHEKNFFAVRAELRSSTVRMIPAAPLFGTGMGTWRAAYPRYATMDAALIANEAHNDWLQWAADGGFPFALLILILAIRAGLASGRRVWGLGLIAVMVHCLVDYPMRSPAISFLWFTLAGSACALRHNRAEIIT